MVKFDHSPFFILIYCFKGDKKEAEYYLSKFKWGLTFINLNKDVLERYSKCKTSEELIKTQNDYIKEMQDEMEKSRSEFFN